ncbi:MAG: hypothetical protein ACREM2_10640 [Vulcanimicrobiaceae bacterium]
MRSWATAALASALLGTLLAAAPARANQSGYLYTYALQDQRYDDGIFSFDAYKPLGSSDAALKPFVDLFLNDDSRTVGGPIPQIFEDDYGGLEAGLQYTRPSGLRVFLQGGATTRIGAVAAVPSGGDVRGGVQLYREWTARAHPQVYGNAYLSQTYYSRYADAISYDQLEIGRHQGGVRGIDLFARGVLNLDTHAYYYANLTELTLGVRFHPFGAHGPSLSFEEAAGSYLRNLPRPHGTGLFYTDFRPTFTYGANI